MDDFTRPPLPEAPKKQTVPEPQNPALSAEEGAIPMVGASLGKTRQKRRWDILHWRHTHLNRPQWILLWVGILAAVLLAAGGMYAIYKSFKSPSHNEQPVIKSEEPEPTTAPSPLTGVEVAIELTKRPVTGVMIENSPAARPQAGLKDAGIVYEAIAEGGITRFLALFQEAQPDYIGPVRSVRPYYLDFLMPFEAGVAHVGGSAQALADIRALGVRDLDQFSNSGAYRRVTNRYAPHNMYTSMADLDSLNTQKGYTSSNFTGYERKKDTPSTQPNATSIDFAISSFNYNVHYDYDPATNSYKRSVGGRPHMDEKSGTQLQPKVVIALNMARGVAGQYTQYTAVGSGHMYVYQDGTVIEGTWSKADRKAPFVFKDGSGAVIKLNAGQTWISIVDAGKVSSK